MTLIPPRTHRGLLPTCQTLHHCNANGHVRASSFAADTSSNLALRQAQQSRNFTLSSWRLPRQCSGRQPTKLTPAVTGARLRSTWGSSWACRMRSSWHRPDCKWIRSDGDPRYIARDRDCPACQEEERRPLELSQRELLWEKKLDALRKFIEKDPYDVLFGRSNERLKGLLRMSPWWSRHTRAQDAVTPGAAFKSTATTDSGRTRSVTVEEASKDATSSQNRVMDESALRGGQTKVESRSASTASVTNEVKPFERSKELHFDPISMRWVPKTSSSIGDTGAIPSGSSSGAVPISGKTFPQPLTTNTSWHEKHSSGDAVQRKTSEGDNESRQVQDSATEPQTNEHDTSEQPVLSMAIEHFRNKALVEAAIPSSLAPATKYFLDKVLYEAKESSDKLKAAQDVFRRMTKWQAAQLENLSTISSSTMMKKTHIQSKEVLELSYKKERESRKATRNLRALKAMDMQAARIQHSLDHISGTVNQSAHFRRDAPLDESDARRMAYSSMNRRDRPYKHMSSHELGQHRAALLASWAGKCKAKAAPTPAEKRLDEEVAAQKAAMTAFENKWRQDEPKDNSLRCEDRGPSPLQGEGDVASNVAKYANTDRWYKRSAPRALVEDPQKAHDRALVREIQSVYESAYGNIDTNHQQGKLKQSLSEYEGNTSSGSSPYTFTTGQDSLEQELQSTRQATVSESNEYDRKIGSDAYTITTGQDSLEQELKAASEVEIGQPAASTIGDATNTVTEPTTPSSRLERAHPITPEASSDPSLYQILAYDPSDQSIYTAAASSSFSPPTGEITLPLPEALSRLYAPAKFIPHLVKHQENGYAVVSANRNLLVLKRISPAAAQPLLRSGLKSYSPVVDAQRFAEHIIQPTRPSLPSAAANKPSNVNPVDGTGRRWDHPPTPQTGNFASPTGFVNHDLYLSNTVPETPAAAPVEPQNKPSRTPSRSNPRVRKEEPVFSGSQRRWDGATDPNPASASVMALASDTGVVEKDGKTRRSGRERNAGEKETGNGSARSTSLRNLAKTTVIVAGCCYVTGVLVEWLRDGGSGSGSGNTSGNAGRASATSSGRSMWSSGSSAAARKQEEEEEARKHEEVVQTMKTVAMGVGGIMCLVWLPGILAKLRGGT